jgi:hypothetical protein
MRPVKTFGALLAGLLLVLPTGCTESLVEPIDVVTVDESMLALAPAESSWDDAVVPWLVDLVVQCAGEEVHFTGHLSIGTHVVTNGNKQIVKAKVRLEEDARGVGIPSGDVWLYAGGLHGVTQTDTWVTTIGQPFTRIFHVVSQFTFQNQTTGQVFDWPENLLVARNAAGEVKVEFHLSPCRLRR